MAGVCPRQDAGTTGGTAGPAHCRLDFQSRVSPLCDGEVASWNLRRTTAAGVRQITRPLATRQEDLSLFETSYLPGTT